MANKERALAFSVILGDRRDDGNWIFVSVGWRVMNGQIFPPSMYLQKANQYTPANLANKVMLRTIYQELQETGWMEKFKIPELQPWEQAILKAFLTEDLARNVAPSLFPAAEAAV